MPAVSASSVVLPCAAGKNDLGGALAAFRQAGSAAAGYAGLRPRRATRICADLIAASNAS